MIFNNILSKTKSFNKENNIFHKGFEIGIILKGISGVFEIIGGIALIFLNPNRLNKLIIILTQDELSEEPKDAIANFIVKLGSHFSLSSQQFGIFYLLSHGIIKIILVILLWKRKTWAYPLTIIFLIMFISYQIYKCFLSYSIVLVVLTIFDIAMIILTLIEYKNIKNGIK